MSASRTEHKMQLAQPKRQLAKRVSTHSHPTHPHTHPHPHLLTPQQRQKAHQLRSAANNSAAANTTNQNRLCSSSELPPVSTACCGVSDSSPTGNTEAKVPPSSPAGQVWSPHPFCQKDTCVSIFFRFCFVVVFVSFSLVSFRFVSFRGAVVRCGAGRDPLNKDHPEQQDINSNRGNGDRNIKTQTLAQRSLIEGATCSLLYA